MKKLISICLVFLLLTMAVPVGTVAETPNLTVDGWIFNKNVIPGQEVTLYAMTNMVDDVTVTAYLHKIESFKAALEEEGGERIVTIPMYYDVDDGLYTGVVTIPSSIISGTYYAEFVATYGTVTAIDDMFTEARVFYDEHILPVVDSLDVLREGDLTTTYNNITTIWENYNTTLNAAGGPSGIMASIFATTEWQNLEDALLANASLKNTTKTLLFIEDKFVNGTGAVGLMDQAYAHKDMIGELIDIEGWDVFSAFFDDIMLHSPVLEEGFYSSPMGSIGDLPEWNATEASYDAYRANPSTDTFEAFFDDMIDLVSSEDLQTEVNTSFKAFNDTAFVDHLTALLGLGLDGDIGTLYFYILMFGVLEEEGGDMAEIAIDEYYGDDGEEEDDGPFSGESWDSGNFSEIPELGAFLNKTMDILKPHIEGLSNVFNDTAEEIELLGNSSQLYELGEEFDKFGDYMDSMDAGYVDIDSMSMTTSGHRNFWSYEFYDYDSAYGWDSVSGTKEEDGSSVTYLEFAVDAEDNYVDLEYVFKFHNEATYEGDTDPSATITIREPSGIIHTYTHEEDFYDESRYLEESVIGTWGITIESDADFYLSQVGVQTMETANFDVYWEGIEDEDITVTESLEKVFFEYECPVDAYTLSFDMDFKAYGYVEEPFLEVQATSPSGEISTFRPFVSDEYESDGSYEAAIPYYYPESGIWTVSIIARNVDITMNVHVTNDFARPILDIWDEMFHVNAVNIMMYPDEMYHVSGESVVMNGVVTTGEGSVSGVIVDTYTLHLGIPEFGDTPYVDYEYIQSDDFPISIVDERMVTTGADGSISYTMTGLEDGVYITVAGVETPVGEASTFTAFMILDEGPITISGLTELGQFAGVDVYTVPSTADRTAVSMSVGTTGSDYKVSTSGIDPVQLFDVGQEEPVMPEGEYEVAGGETFIADFTAPISLLIISENVSQEIGTIKVGIVINDDGMTGTLDDIEYGSTGDVSLSTSSGIIAMSMGIVQPAYAPFGVSIPAIWEVLMSTFFYDFFFGTDDLTDGDMYLRGHSIDFEDLEEAEILYYVQNSIISLSWGTFFGIGGSADVLVQAHAPRTNMAGIAFAYIMGGSSSNLIEVRAVYLNNGAVTPDVITATALQAKVDAGLVNAEWEVYIEEPEPVDTDGDGYTNEEEDTAGSDKNDIKSTPLDKDGDGVPVSIDEDDNDITVGATDPDTEPANNETVDEETADEKESSSVPGFEFGMSLIAILGIALLSFRRKRL